MATIETEKDFLELLPILAQHNADLGELNKSVKEDKNTLKEYMLAQDIESADAGGWTVTCSESKKTSMDEPKILEILQKLIKEATGAEKETLQNLIVMKPSINEQLLEDLIYDERIKKEVIEPAVIETVNYTLRFKKSKRKKAKK
jgi:hypothetical protein